MSSYFSSISQTFDISDPKNVYDSVRSQINQMIDKLQNIKSANISIGADNHEKSLQILKEISTSVEESVNQFENNAEWHNFTIAFFGETNAGKSTLIDTLRIALKEPTKIRNQEEYRRIRKEFGLSKEQYEDAKTKASQFKENLEILENQKNSIVSNFDGKLSEQEILKSDILSLFNKKIDELNKEFHVIDDNEKAIRKLEKRIELLKSQMSWWMKIIHIFIKLDEEKEYYRLLQENKLLEIEKETEEENIIQEKEENLAKIKEVMNVISQEKDKALSDNEIKTSELHRDFEPVKQYLEQFEINKEKLSPYVDGKVIGDGRSDYTRDNTEYHFNINNFPTVMIDVPGIEGKEGLVIEQIEKAVQKAHAVFYVTAKDAPPNEGTLEKIKKHLGDQTEVWTIYNKQATNIRAIKKDLINSNDERKAINALSDKLKEVLGDHYKDLIVVAGLPAFLSQADCLEPFSALEESRNKFTKDLSSEELAEKSNLSQLISHLGKDVVGDVDEKIKKSNLNKIKVLIDENISKLKDISNGYELYEKDVSKQVKLAKLDIDKHFELFKSVIKRDSNNLINDFKTNSRQEMYDYIDNGIDNDDFKSRFNEVLKQQADIFEQNISQVIEKAINQFADDIKDTEEKLKRDVNKISSDYSRYSHSAGLGKFNPSFELDNGINTLGLVGTLVGVGAAMWWNPVGWFAIGATVLGLAFSFYKSIRGFFSSDYKKSQQRKSVNENLPDVCKKLEESVKDSMQNLQSEMSKHQDKIKAEFNFITDAVKQVNQDLTQMTSQFSTISQKLGQN